MLNLRKRKLKEVNMEISIENRLPVTVLSGFLGAGKTSVHEAIYSLIMMKNNFISASANISEMDDEAKNYPIVTQVEKDVNLNAIMSNSFGFGGTNATLVFEKV